MPISRSCLLMVFVWWSAIVVVGAQDGSLQVMEATFKLYNKDSTATALLIRPAAGDSVVLVTAAHVFKRMSGDEAILVLRQPKDDGSWERKDHRIAVRA